MKRQVLSLLFVLSILVTVCVAESPKTATVTFYHTSDNHEHAAELVRIAGFVDAKRKDNPNVLLVDSGDWFNKGDLTPLNTRGDAVTEMLGACKYDALIFGNHDYSFGTKRLVELIDKHSLPVVAANCRWPEDAKPKNALPYKIFKLKGVTVAIIGTATPISTQRQDTLMKILTLDMSLRELVADLDRRVDVVALLTHVGVSEDQKLARALPGLDVIFGGHHHKRFKTLNFDEKTQTVIQHSGSMGNHIGELIISWDGEKIVDRKLRLLEVTKDMPKSATVAAVREKYLSATGSKTQSTP